jgi:hypothetical protein
MATPSLIPASQLYAQAAPAAPAEPAPAAPAAPATPAAPAPAAPAAPDAPAAPAAPAPGTPAPAAPAAPGTPAPAAPGTPDQPAALPAAPKADPVVAGADAFWHYGKIAKYDLAVAEGQKLLDSGASSLQILEALEAAAADRRDPLDDTLYKWLNVESMKDVTGKLITKVKEGQLSRHTDRAWIKKQIARLAVNERAFELGMNELRNSGEIAVPVMIDVLRDPNESTQQHGATRRGLVRLGRTALNPLVAVMESKDRGTLREVAGILGDIGYDAAAPYIARVYASKGEGMDEVKAAMASALARLGVDARTAKPADLFYDLAEKFYYRNASILHDPRYQEANIWYWDDVKGLTLKAVPPQIFNDRMSERCAEYALKADPSRGDVVALWLAANNRREADLPEGKTDASHEGPDAHYYNVALGTQYCNEVLKRALRDRTPAVALKVVKSLSEIIGQSNMFQGPNTDKEPIVQAMAFPARLVRFEAAMTLASALPQKPFVGQEAVVPTLAEAIGATGRPNVVIVMPDANAANGVKESLKDAVKADTGSDPASAQAAEGRLPSVDVLVVDSRNNPQTDEILGGARVRGVAKLLIVENKASPYVAAEFDNQLINTLVAGAPGQAPDPAALTEAIMKARERAGATAMDEASSAAYAQRAATLLERLAISRGQVLDVTTATPALVRALDDSRVEIAKSAAAVLSLIDVKDVQATIAAKALDEKSPDDLKVAAFKAVARSAKFWGNQLNADMTDALQKVVETHANLQVRSAAAEAQGALNLPPDRAKNLIINQSQVGK